MSPLTLHSRFTDFDAFSEAAVQWNIDFVQLDRGCFQSEFLHHLSPQAYFSRVQLGRRIRQRGQGPEGYRTFAVPATSSLDLDFRYEKAGADDLLVFPRDGDLASVSEPGFDMFVLSFPNEKLETAVSKLRLPSDPIHSMRAGVHRGWPGLMDRLRVMCHRTEQVVHAASANAVDSTFLQACLDELCEVLLVAMVNLGGVKPKRSPTARRTTGLKRALEMVDSMDTENLRVSELCHRAGVSERSLEYAFRERFAMGPKAFIQAHRLNRVRQILRKTEASVFKVTDAANHYGFWHMGQFAADYRGLFGELPSETRRANGEA